ncbi:MAG TPA: hypothetical protein DCG52_01680 [Alphaproteobacteria bacterium]|nr:hypothetical protein [Alphaproteobacteria bacterium]|tara:strand:- start:2641 stop:3555 length:915 start_codon:yes stop_codon:yes gene_type:complete
MSLSDKTVTELRKLAKDNNIRLEQGIKKQDLIDTLEVYMKKVETQENVNTNVFDDEFFEPEGQDGLVGSTGDDEIQIEDNSPAIGSDEWHEYVMSHFKSNELIDGNPTCAGLRRVAEILLGEIVFSGPTQIFPATDPNGPGRATVVFTVEFNWMNSGMSKSFAEVADVWHGNTDDLFCAHPVATASTRAEGRALRKALKVRVLAAEELAKKDIVNVVQQSISTSGEYNPDDRISPQQVTFIDNKCKQLDINVVEFINIGAENYRSINDVKRESGKKMIRVLNEYQNQTTPIPEHVLSYQEDWRN